MVRRWAAFLHMFERVWVNLGRLRVYLIAFPLLVFGLSQEVVAEVAPARSHIILASTSAPLSDSQRKLAPLLRRGDKILHELTGDDTHAYLGFSPHLQILDSPQPNAFASRSDRVVISSAIANIARNSSELAFVVAHELGHLALNRAGRGHQGESVLHDELAADRYAVKLLSQSGFDTEAAVTFLETLTNYGSEEGVRLGDLYPTIEARLRALRTKDESI